MMTINNTKEYNPPMSDRLPEQGMKMYAKLKRKCS